MQYAILVIETESDRARRREGGPPQRKVDAAYRAYTEALVEAGVMRGGEALAISDYATTVVDGDPPRIQDGPYADTKEQLGGFFVLECADLDEAIRWARRCPASKVEIRPTIVPPSRK